MISFIYIYFEKNNLPAIIRLHIYFFTLKILLGKLFIFYLKLDKFVE